MREQIHGEAGSVHIPGYLLPVRLSTLAISYRLLVALRHLRRSFIGDLDGLSSKHLLDVDARGSDLMTELIDLIQSIPAAPQHYDSSSTDPPAKSRLQIPRCAPRRFHYRSRHLARPPCNASSPSENRRLTIQPLTPIPKFPGDLSKLLTALEQRLARFIPRDLAIIKLRYGAVLPLRDGDLSRSGSDERNSPEAKVRSGPSERAGASHWVQGEVSSHPSDHPRAGVPATLLDICRNLTLTPEGVRHILHERLDQLRQSPDILEPTTQLASFCHQHQCILTPALLSQWLPTPRVGRSVPAEPLPSPLPGRGLGEGAPAEITNRLSPIVNSRDFPFLLRLLSELNPNLPTWPSAKTLH